jgi:hypothetical protein
MIVKDGESIAHLKIRIEKELSELEAIDIKLAEDYRKEAVRDIFNATLQQKFEMQASRNLIEYIDPEFYTKPNQLRKSTMNQVYIQGTALVFASLVGIVCFGLFLAVIFSF